MIKTKIIIVALVFSMLGIFNMNAYAYPSRLSGWSIGKGSVLIDTSWVGVPDPSIEPTTVYVTIYPTVIRVHYQNPGGNLGGIGDPFYTTGAFTTAGVLDDQNETKKGKYKSTITFPFIGRFFF